jgi:hypothetical protein
LLILYKLYIKKNFLCKIYAMLQFLAQTVETVRDNGLHCRASTNNSRENFLYGVFPTSLAVTEGILVSFYFYAALNNMLKFSA